MADSEKVKLRIAQIEAERGGEAPEVETANDAPTLTDHGNGMRFARAWGEDVRYVFSWRKWLVWDGTRWAFDETGAVHRMAKQVAVGMNTQLPPVGPDEAAWRKWAHNSLDDSVLDSMIKMARSEEPIPARPDWFDRDPYLFNCTNGTINLLTGEFYEPRREDLLMKQAGVAYPALWQHAETGEVRRSETKPGPLYGPLPANSPEPAHNYPAADALCPTWINFLCQVMDDDEEMIQFLQRSAGYSLSGVVKERVLFILHGSGKNGKSTFVETIQALMGDYATVTPVETLLVQKFSSIPNDIAALKDVRFVTASETEESARLATAKIKGLTGGDTLTARFMRGEFFKFTPTFKLWLSTNHKPSVRESSKALWDRIRLVPFAVRIKNEDKELKSKLLAELPGILLWALEGFKQYLEIGLAPPQTVVDAVEQYRAEQDQVGHYLEDRTDQVRGARVVGAELYEDYKTWCKDNGEYTVTKTKFGQRLIDRGIERADTNKNRGWRDLTLKSPISRGGGNPPSESAIRERSDQIADEDDLFKV